MPQYGTDKGIDALVNCLHLQHKGGYWLSSEIHKGGNDFWVAYIEDINNIWVWS